MRPKTSTDLSLDNKFHLGKFEKSTDQKYGIIIKTSPFSKAFLLEDISAIGLSDKEDEFPSWFITPGKTTTPIQYINDKYRLIGLLWTAYDVSALEQIRKRRTVRKLELYRAYDQINNYFLIPLRRFKEHKWRIGTSPLYQLTYFGVPTIATSWDIWEHLYNMFGQYRVYSFKYFDYDFNLKQARKVFATQFTYLVDVSRKVSS